MHPVAGEAGMRVAVDEPRDGGEAASVDLDDVPRDPGQLAHAADGLDACAVTDDVGVFDHAHRAQGVAAERCGHCGGRHDLREVVHEQPTHVVLT